MTVIELNSGKRRSRASLPRKDKRMYARLESDDRLFVQVVLSAMDPDLIGTTVACHAVNLSIGGIQFHTMAKMPIGALLDLWVDVRSRPGKFFLAGEIRWVRPASDEGDEFSGWVVGVQLRAGAATDIVDWQEFHVQTNTR
jgi:Tfp pilus assembly protein PilZ